MSENFWIGGEETDGIYKWTDGSKVGSYGWFPGEPNGPDEKCLDLYLAHDFKMNDQRCDFSIPYVCEVVLETKDVILYVEAFTLCSLN